MVGARAYGGVCGRGTRWLVALMASAVLVQTAQAQDGPSPDVAQIGRERTFSIPPQSLVDGLTVFGQQSGLQVSVHGTLVRGIQTPGVSGTMTPQQALERLLAGTGLTWRIADGNTVILDRPPRASGDPQALDPVMVEGERGTGPVKGYVATRSAVGTKTNTPLIETPQAISVVTRDQMDARAVQTMTEALRYTPGVFTQPFGTDRRYDQVYIRGFTGTNYSDYRDGLRQPTVNFAGFNSEPYGLERIEVLRGPTSVLYGQNQPGGIINRVSKRPTAQPFYEVQVGGGSNDRVQGAFDLGGPLDKDRQFLFRLTGVARSADHPLFSQLPDDRLYIAPAFTWRPNADTNFTILASYQKDETFTFRNAPMTLTGIPAALQPPLLDAFRRNYLGEPNWDRFNREQLSIGYSFEHKFNDVLTVRQNARYAHNDIDFRQMEGAGYNATLTTLLRNARRWKEELGVWTLDNQVQAAFTTFGVAHTALVGFDYQYIGWSQTNRLGPAPSIGIYSPTYGQAVAMPAAIVASSRQNISQRGVYAQDQIKFADHWVLTLGGRHDWADSQTRNRLAGTITRQSDSAFSWRAGLTYLSSIGLAPYLSYSESFLPTAGTTASGTPYKPTRGRQYEAGIKFQPKDIRSFVTLSAFHLTQRNVLTPDPANLGFNVQTGEVRSRGIELEGVASLGLGLDLIASYTWQDVEVTATNAAGVRGKRPILVPERMASLWADYTVTEGPMTGFGVGAGIRYVGATYGDTTNTVRNRATTLVDAVVHYDLAHLVPSLSGMRVAVNVTNLFDKNYTICSSGSCYLTSGRTVLATLKFRW